jgi:hypothetical protein
MQEQSTLTGSSSSTLQRGRVGAARNRNKVGLNYDLRAIIHRKGNQDPTTRKTSAILYDWLPELWLPATGHAKTHVMMSARGREDFAK